MDAETDRYRTTEDIRVSYVEQMYEQWFGIVDPGEQHQAHNSELGRTVTAITKAAVEHYDAVRAPVEGGPDSLYGLMQRGIDWVHSLRFGLQEYGLPDEARKKARLTLWSHRTQPLYDVTRQVIPHFGRSDIEAAVGEYLDLPYRSRHVDRLLVDILIAMEANRFSNQMLGPQYMDSSPLKVRPVRRWLFVTIYETAVFGLVSALVFVAFHYGLISEAWLLGIQVAWWGLFVVTMGIATVTLPARWNSARKQAALTRKLISEAFGLYEELKSDGPISAHHIRERLNATTALGIVWPAPTFALLDDVISRSGRL